MYMKNRVKSYTGAKALSGLFNFGHKIIVLGKDVGDLVHVLFQKKYHAGQKTLLTEQTC